MSLSRSAMHAEGTCLRGTVVGTIYWRWRGNRTRPHLTSGHRDKGRGAPASTNNRSVYA
jgi:hypothetical protein